jgi:hypothetical protein
MSPLAGRRHGSRSAVANFRTAELGQRTCCSTYGAAWCAGIAAYLFYKNSAVAKCISGISIKVL